jgi:predicted O-linked N-acetylglucosamine transferase (SPINDLY family)
MKTSPSSAATISSPELQAAAAALAAGDHGAAIAQLRQLAGTDGHSPDVWRLLGEAIQAQGGDPLPELQRWAQADPRNPVAHAMLGQALQDRGDLAGAGACYRQALTIDPSYLDALIQLGSVEQGMGNADVAAECYELALQARPALHDLYPSLASALHAAGRHEEATAAWSKAIRLLGDEPVLHYGRSESLYASGRVGEALNASERVVKLMPDDPMALAQLAFLQMATGNLHASALNFGKSLLHAPDNLSAHIDFAIVLHDLGLTDEAISHLHDALRIDPQSWLAAGNLGGLLIEQGRHADALAWLRHALDLRPNYATALNNTGTALQALGDNVGAMHYFREAIVADNSYIDAYRNLSIVLSRLGQHREALENSAAALSLAPDNAELLLNLANAQAAMGQPARSIPNLRKAAKLNPKAANIRSNLAHFLSHMGQTDEAIGLWQKAIELEPGFADAYSNLLFCLSHTDLDPAVARGVRAGFARQFERQALWARPARPTPDRPLNVGFVSGDFYEHAVDGFIEPALRQLAGRPGIQLFAYYNNTITDHKTARLQALVPHWRNVHHLGDEALDETIRRDAIDILIDLSGHTGFNRLPVFARKPAPVQATWIGYPGSTGLHAMDYIITDRTVLPPDEAAREFSEQPAYLPTCVTYEPDARAPAVSALPATARGHVTFGSFNRPSKITHATVEAWARVLLAVPGAQMFIAGVDPSVHQPQITGWFAEAGVTAERLRWAPRVGVAEYLGLHGEVDLCLDTMPYSGGTTTLNAAFMGVPTLTVAGNAMAKRSSAGAMAQLGLEGWIANDVEEFVRRGTALAQDTAALAALRATMRDRFLQSGFGNAVLFADSFESALRTMWQRCCAGQPAGVIG